MLSMRSLRTAKRERHRCYSKLSISGQHAPLHPPHSASKTRVNALMEGEGRRVCDSRAKRYALVHAPGWGETGKHRACRNAVTPTRPPSAVDLPLPGGGKASAQRSLILRCDSPAFQGRVKQGSLQAVELLDHTGDAGPRAMPAQSEDMR